MLKTPRCFALLFSVFVGVLCLSSADLVRADDRKIAVSETVRVSLAHDGINRSYLAYLPSRYDDSRAWPVVMMLHGGGGTGRAAARETGWIGKAEQKGFIAVFPEALPRNPNRRSRLAGNPQLWNDGSGRFHRHSDSLPDDVGFLNTVLDDLAARFTVDDARIFVSGFSNGASMAFHAGVELQNRIAAIAPVSGAYWGESPPDMRFPVSVYYITGTADPLNPLQGGVPVLPFKSAAEQIPKPPVQVSVDKWVTALGCADTASDAESPVEVKTILYQNCKGGTQVIFTSVAGLGHHWPGGRNFLPEKIAGPGRTYRDFDATDEIWTFFSKNMRTP